MKTIISIASVIFILSNGAIESYESLKQNIISQFGNKIPVEWGEMVGGVKTILNTNQKIIALTFDACGTSPRANGYDAKLINYLENEKISATLFLSGAWIDANMDISQKLGRNKLFDIENHGLSHKPCSVNGKSAYGIKGTNSVSEVVDEIEQNARKIESLTGRKPRYYRSGTAYYDEIGVQIAEALGYKVVNFSIIGDGGARFSKDRIKNTLLSATRGAIIILHMNHPEGETSEGVMAAIPELIKRGFKFVKLSEYNLK